MDLPETDYERLVASDILTDEAKAFLPERTQMWLRCHLYEDVRAAALAACMNGIPGKVPGYLFFFYYFATIFEERNPPGLQRLPFIPYPYQIRELAVIHRAVQGGVGVLGNKSVIIWLKSRDMGLTWLVLMYFLWDFLFNKGIFHLGSRKEEEVDKLGDPGTLFGKMRICMNALPEFFKPKNLSDKMLLLSYDNGETSITGESANPAFGRGKRKKAVALDEFQDWEYDREAVRSASSTTNTILLVGTPKGYGNFYSEVARGKAKLGQDIRRVHWSEHPLKNRGMETRNGKLWSPWYQKELDSKTPEFVASEIDLSFETSVKGPVFSQIYGFGHQKRGLKPDSDYPVTRCWDPGGGFFAVMFIQVVYVKGKRRVMVLREICTEGANLDTVAEMVLSYTEELCRTGMKIIDHRSDHWKDWFSFEDPGDPSGGQAVAKSNQEVPEYEDLYTKHGINVEWSFMASLPTNLRVRARILSIQNAMQSHISTDNPETDGPAFWVDIDQCPVLDEALRGGYRRKTDTAGNVMDAIEERHPYVDVVDALGYGCVYKLGIPEQIKREHQRKTEEQKEDEDGDNDAYPASKRRRC